MTDAFWFGRNRRHHVISVVPYNIGYNSVMDFLAADDTNVGLHLIAIIMIIIVQVLFNRINFQILIYVSSRVRLYI